MIAPAGRFVRALLLGAAIAIGPAGTVLAEESPPPTQPSPVEQVPPAGATLSAQPSVVSATIDPGSQGRATVTLRAARAMDITIEPQGLGQSADDGSFTFLGAEEDTSPYTARPYIEVAPSSFRMEAGDAREIALTISLPEGPADGERYALLKVTGIPAAGDGNVGIGVALGVSVLVNVPGSPTSIAGSITDLTVPEIIPGEPVSVAGLVENTGNMHYGAPPNGVYQVATLRNAKGEALATSRETLGGNSIVPTFGRRFALTIDPGQQLTPGEYSVDVEVGLEDGTVLDAATATVTAAGANPVPPATAGPADDLLPFIAAGLLGAAVALIVLLVVLLPRRLRRGSTT
jgi:hypothetical protein